MKYLPIILALLFLANPCYSATEIYTGHSIRGMSLQTPDEITGFLVDVGPLKAGGGLLGSAPYAHVIVETPWRAVFVGIGVGAVGLHYRLDGTFQFTLTAGVRLGPVVLRWLHFSNGADILRNGDRGARRRNHGIDCLTLGFTF